MNIFVTRKDGWWGEGYIIESEYEDGKTWKGTRAQAIKNYCSEKGINQKEHNWYKEQKGEYVLFKKAVV